MLPWQQEPRRVFQAYLDSDRVPHAILVTGPSGTGKFAFAQAIARELLCLEGKPEGCGSCRSCTWFDGGAHPDFRDITFEVNENTGKLRDVIVVRQIRRMIEALYKTTTVGTRKVALIHPAERMNASAANALLKTLEEPVGETVLILVAHDAGRLPATVRSRCQRLPVTPPARVDALQWLIDTRQAEPDAAELALTAAAGRPLEAQEMLGSETIEHYRGTLRLLSMLRRGTASDGKALAAMAEFDPVNLWTWLSVRCADLVHASLVEGVPGSAVRPLTELQRLADRNRMLTGTPVRQDLLLRDWLIQWKDLPAALPLDRDTQEA